MFYFFVFIFGNIIGSYLNVIIFRLQKKERIITKHSHCPHCQKNLAAKDLIPIASFFILKGRCRYCSQKISWQYPLLEAAAGLVFILITYNTIGGLGWSMLFISSSVFWLWVRNLVFASFLIIIFIYDLRWYLILDKITLPAMVAVLLFNLFLGFNLINLLIAALIAFGFFFIQFSLSRGRWIGGGDLRLGALMGLMLGWPNILVALFFAYIIGAVCSLLLVAFGQKGFKSQMPFGTFLTLGTLIALLYGETIISWYLRLF
ncbi:MAG: prepilin peptidase [Patescibacteria group bacterium]